MPLHELCYGNLDWPLMLRVVHDTQLIGFVATTARKLLVQRGHRLYGVSARYGFNDSVLNLMCVCFAQKNAHLPPRGSRLLEAAATGDDGSVAVKRGLFGLMKKSSAEHAEPTFQMRAFARRGNSKADPHQLSALSHLKAVYKQVCVVILFMTASVLNGE